MLKAGYLEEWKYHQSYSGVPQGGTISPLLSNVYLHELDQFVERLMDEFNVGKRRPKNPEYEKLARRRHRLRQLINQEGKKPELIEEFREVGRKMKEIPSGDTHGNGFKRLKYCRYADDFIIGITGTKRDAKEVMQKVVTFLQEKLNLQVADDKSNLLSAKKGVHFLSYHIRTWRSGKTKKVRMKGSYTTQRTVCEHINLSVPMGRVIQFCQKNGYGDWSQTKPIHRPELMNSSDVEIITTYNAELRGIANYYCLADDVKRRLSKLQYLSQYSLLKTLSNKHKTKKSVFLKKMNQGNELIYRCEGMEVKVFKLKHMTLKPRNWEADEIPNTLWLRATKSELVRRLNAKECEYCGRSDIPREVHHVKKLKNLKSKPNKLFWQKIMIARNRKTLILCEKCHDLLHAGKLPDARYNSKSI